MDDSVYNTKSSRLFRVYLVSSKKIEILSKFLGYLYIVESVSMGSHKHVTF